MTILSHTKKALVTMAAALTLGGAVIASAAPAEAGWRYGCWGCGYGYGYGGAVAAGVIGGLALGAIAAAAAQPAPVVAVPACTVARRKFVDRYGRLVTRTTQVC